MAKVLVIGSGGREHALAWRLIQSSGVEMVYVAPGNAGTARESKMQNVPLDGGQITDLADFVEANGIDLTLVGPEAPLARGIVDYFHKRGLKIFGPTQKAAQLESSKDFAKRFMVRHNIPTAMFGTFTDAKDAHAYIEREGAPIVVKADGLAAGKGVVIAMTLEEAHRAVDNMLCGNKFGEAGSRVVIEEFLDGEEASFIVMADGKHVLPFASSQDHKRLLNDDQGPNTGGMGAYSPAPVVTSEVHARVMQEIIMPTVNGMAADGIPFTGFLYAGLMIASDGKVRVLEFNVRMGDPETQPIMMRLRSDLLELLGHACVGTLDQVRAEWDPCPALGVVLAAQGYPETPVKGTPIRALPEDTNSYKIFHAGTAEKDGVLVTAGGRVLCVTALGANIALAQMRAYRMVNHACFDGSHYRTDIGHRAIGG